MGIRCIDFLVPTPRETIDYQIRPRTYISSFKTPTFGAIQIADAGFGTPYHGPKILREQVNTPAVRKMSAPSSAGFLDPDTGACRGRCFQFKG